MADTEKLRATLAELEAELRDVRQLDPETKAMLERALAEMQATLRGDQATEPTEPHTLTEHLERSATEFEGSHPAIAQLMHRVIDALAQLGI